MKKIIKACGIGILIVVASKTYGSTDYFSMSLQELVNVKIATGTEKKISETPAVVSVVTEQDIAKMGARTLAEALEHIPGLHVMPSINRLQPLFSFRGIFTDSTSQVLVLMDGVEMSELTALSTPYSFRLPTHFIERIEVIRGPGSAVYGANAFSGVINIITKNPTGDGAINAGIRLGSFDSVETWIDGQFTLDKVKVALSLTHEEENSDDDRRTQYGVLRRDREMDNVHLNAEYGNFSFKNWYWRTEQLMGVGAGIFGNDLDTDISTSWHSQISWSSNLSQNVETAIDLSYSISTFDAFFQLFPPGVWPVGSDGNLFLPPFTPVDFPNGVIGEPEAETRRVRLDTSFVYSYDRHRVRLGFGAEHAELTNVREIKNFGPGILDAANLPVDGISRELIDVTGTPFVYSPEYDRDLWYVSIQDEWKINDNFEVTAGLRFDDYSDFGGTTNPRLALLWKLSDEFNTKLILAKAFRAPKVAELAFINNPTTLGNPNVRPEKIESVELAFSYRPNETFQGRLNVFNYQSKDLIQLDSFFTYQNIGDQEGRGLELELEWQSSKWLTFNVNLSWLDSELPFEDREKERVPGLMGYFDVRYQASDNIIFTMQNYLILDRNRQAGDLRPEVDDYLQSDVNFLWNVAPDWQIAFGIKNLLNETIIEPVPDSALFAAGLGFPGDYPMKSRNLFGEVTYRF